MGVPVESGIQVTYFRVTCSPLVAAVVAALDAVAATVVVVAAVVAAVVVALVVAEAAAVVAEAAVVVEPTVAAGVGLLSPQAANRHVVSISKAAKLAIFLIIDILLDKL